MFWWSIARRADDRTFHAVNSVQSASRRAHIASYCLMCSGAKRAKSPAGLGMLVGSLRAAASRPCSPTKVLDPA